MVHRFGNVDAHDIAVDDADIVVMLQRLVQYGQQMVVQLNGGYSRPRFGQRLGQGADARPDFQHGIAGLELRRCGDIVDDSMADEKILAQLLVHAQAEAIDDVAYYVGIGQINVFHCRLPPLSWRGPLPIRRG